MGIGIIEFIIAAAVVTIIVLFLISVFAPSYSDKPFWRFIKKARDAMDFVSYWILTGGLIFTAAAWLIHVCMGFAG